MTPPDGRSDVADWWRTRIIDMEPGRISLRGRPIEEMIGTVSFPAMIWLMLRGTMPGEAEAALLEAALVASVDHGPQAPSIAAARMAVTCGLPLNAAMASAVNMLGDVHGGAGQQAIELYHAIDAAWHAEAQEGREASERDDPDADTVAAALERWTAEHGRYVPGFGHRFHPVDPRAPRLMRLVADACAEGIVSGRFMRIAQAIEAGLRSAKGRPIPMNIDGATAVIYAELGFAPPLARGLFCLSRSVGILAHAWEQTEAGGRNKGPTPPAYRWTYDGPPTETSGDVGT